MYMLKTMSIVYWTLAIKTITQYQYLFSTRNIIAWLSYCFGFDVFKYCIFTDGVFEMLLIKLLNGGIIITDTYVLYYTLYRICKDLNIKIYYFDLLNKPICAKSCIQIDLYIKLLTVISNTNPVIIIGTSPTTILRVIETMVLFYCQSQLIIVSSVGHVNTSIAKVYFKFCKHNIDYCVLRGKLGGIAFAFTMVNGILMV